MNAIKMEIIKKYRTQERFAIAAGVNETVVSKILRGSSGLPKRSGSGLRYCWKCRLTNYSEKTMSSTANTPALLDASEVAKRLRVSRPYIYRLVELNLLQAVAWAVPGQVKARKVIRFHPDDVAAFIARHRGATT